jgi:hypothetical protein
MATRHFAIARRIVLASSAMVLVAALAPAPAGAEIIAQGVRGPVVAEGAPFTGAVAYFTCSRAGTAPTDFLATIDWVDGTTSTGTITSDGSGGYFVQGQHTYANSGIYRLGIRLEDLVDGYVTTRLRIGVH